jgi:hypothetical protein
LQPALFNDFEATAPAASVAFDFAPSIRGTSFANSWLAEQRRARHHAGKANHDDIRRNILNGIPVSQWLTRMAIAASPSTYAMGGFGSVSANPSTRDVVLSVIAVGIELALFILIPIYLRSRRRAKIRSRIRILYDSRLEPALAMRVAQTRSASPLLRPTKSSRRAVREIGPSGAGW